MKKGQGRDNPLLQNLLDDHEHIRKSLDDIEKLYTDMANGGNPDISRMLRDVAYLQDHTEQVHHPIEDIIFSVLLKNDSGVAKLLNILVTDHTKMEQNTHRLRVLLESLKSNTSVDMHELENILPSLLKRLRHHMLFEEQNIFPLINSSITGKDWENIRIMIQDSVEPKPGKDTTDDYKPSHNTVNMRD